MVDIIELLSYNREVRYRYFETLSKLSWDELIKNREASYHSIRNIFIHTLNAIDYWLDVLLRENKRQTKRQFEEYKSIDYIRRYMGHVETRMESYINSVTSKGLKARYQRKDDRGEDIEVTAEDILIHVFEEEVHHRGELIALLWQMGVEPPLMGWKYL